MWQCRNKKCSKCQRWLEFLGTGILRGVEKEQELFLKGKRELVRCGWEAG